MQREYTHEIEIGQNGEMHMQGKLENVPEHIYAFHEPPLISAIGIPEKLFGYKTCVEYKSKHFSDVLPKKNTYRLLDARFKVEERTIHLNPDDKICGPESNIRTGEIYVGLHDSLEPYEPVKKDMILHNLKQLKAKSVISIYAEPIYKKREMFPILVVTFLPIYWGILLTGREISKWIYK